MNDNALFLYQKIENFKEFTELPNIPDCIIDNLSPSFKIREYQEEAFKHFITYMENDNFHKNKQPHLLFHMATGAGKTYIMAGSIIYLYSKGYRNFLFFVNTNNIIEKTKDNFLNKESSKYLFNEEIIINGEKINVNIVDTFEDSIDNCINIKFTTIQQLHIDLNNHKENSLTLNDFEDREIVLISDESHHVNSDTKKKPATKAEKESNDSWEKSVTNIFRANKNNIMLEFTATCDLKNANVNEKYKDKIVFDYPLLKFRESGYTKDFYNLQSSYNALHRTIQAMLLSQYRLKLFEKYGKTIKPVILLKSKNIIENNEFLDNFINYIKNEFSEEDIQIIRRSASGVIEKMFSFFDEECISDEILVQELKSSFSEEHIISIHSKDKDISEKQTLLNNLEDISNPYRMIFTVDMLNEGWDVLNLFDIVRLYDERQGKTGQHTIKEAQLIGRGARYCPFRINDYDDKYKRKFDNDLDNELRICETLYFHSKEDSKYIDELRRALREIGFESENETVEFEYKVKDEFKNTPIYSNGKLFINERVKKDKSNIDGLPSNINIDNTIDLTNHKIKEASLVTLSTTKEEKQIYYTHNLKIKDIDSRVVKKALRQFPIMRFNILKGYFPNLKSIDEFIASKKYAGKIELTIYTDNQEVNNLELYSSLVKVFEVLSSKISKIKEEYEGTTNFIEEPLKNYVKDNKRFKINPDREGEGVSQNSNTVNKDYRLDLTNEDWFVYNDNYGTTEEKRFVKYFSTKVEELKNIYSEVYLIRNERSLHIYSFKDGARFEPDYILLLRKKKGIDFEQQQIFVEPKGKHLRKNDEWKQEFMLELEKESKAILYHEDGSDYKIIGLPFYTHDEGLQEFKDAFEKTINV